MGKYSRFLKISATAISTTDMKALEINGDGRAREEVQLVLATGGFFVCFAIFGSVAGMMPATNAKRHLVLVDLV